MALKGSTDAFSSGVCITSPAATATPDGSKIAAQCCTASGECKRRTTNSNTACIAGAFGSNSFVEMTFDQAEAACTSRGLVMCERSCAGEGCFFNNAYVWTGLSCPSPPPLPLSSPPLPLPLSESPPPPPSISPGCESSAPPLMSTIPLDEATLTAISHRLKSIEEDTQGQPVYEYERIVPAAATANAASGDKWGRVRRMVAGSEGVSGLMVRSDPKHNVNAVKELSIDLLSKICDTYQCPDMSKKSELATLVAIQVMDALDA
jgi:hypothetical protein